MLGVWLLVTSYGFYVNEFQWKLFYSLEMQWFKWRIWVGVWFSCFVLLIACILFLLLLHCDMRIAIKKSSSSSFSHKILLALIMSISLTPEHLLPDICFSKCTEMVNRAEELFPINLDHRAVNQSHKIKGIPAWI